MNDEQFLSALSAQEVEIVLSNTDEQDALTSWHLRFGLANRPFAVVDKPEESAHRPWVLQSNRPERRWPEPYACSSIFSRREQFSCTIQWFGRCDK